jgi:hypothetical protein
MNAVRLLFASAVALAVFAPVASAEEVVLRSGARYDARSVEILPGATVGEGSVRFSFVMGQGGGTMTLPFDRIEPSNLFGLVISRTNFSDPKAHLELARFALARGLLGEAENRFRRAATLDASLVPERDAGLATIRRLRSEQALAVAEADHARGRSDLALTGAQAVLGSAEPGSPVASKAAGIVDLARRVVERDKRRLEAQEAARLVAAAEAQRSAFETALSRADAAIVAAVKERARVGDPDLSATSAIRALEGAEPRLREGRRLLATAAANAGDRHAEVAARDKEALALLVATDLDLADLHRLARRFERARDFLRAAQALDPQEPRIREIRALIEQDLRTPVYPDPEYYPQSGYYLPPVVTSRYPYPYPFGSTYRSGSYVPGTFRGTWGSSFRWRFHW